MLSSKNLRWVVLIGLIGALSVYPAFLLKNEKALADDFLLQLNSSKIPLLQNTTFLPIYPFPQSSNLDVKARIKVIVTAYSSSPWETQGDPFITASGERVREGIVANNLLPFGTRIRLPQLYGNKIFVVKDRMNPKKSPYHIDIWFPSREQALKFGVRITEMEVLKE